MGYQELQCMFIRLTWKYKEMPIFCYIEPYNNVSVLAFKQISIRVGHFARSETIRIIQNNYQNMLIRSFTGANKIVSISSSSSQPYPIYLGSAKVVSFCQHKF
eukprot:TRINITY_DN10245_c0_g6_i1.p1 TRINITY_DN10245_c0_g6~~TRINITY_DN10245_c0_g6_i1.p1  ORF type:complete len:103 (+),score=0.12 TRINITY_DN10245_c0_g6_i1:83-391(+)